MNDDKTISTKEIDAFQAALRALSDASVDAIDRMRSEGIDIAESTNYTTALRGFDYILKFVNGIAGTVATAKYREKLDPVIASIKKELKKEASDASGKAKVGRPKKKG